MAQPIFLALVGAFFAYLLIESRTWPLGAALLSRLVTGVGLSLLLVHIISRVRHTVKQGHQASAILDIGFTDAGLEPQMIRGRMLRFFGSTAALFLGVWLLGFHIALPLYVFLYLFVYGRVQWWWALVAALSFEAVLIGLYDHVLHISWNEPIVKQFFGARR